MNHKLVAVGVIVVGVLVGGAYSLGKRQGGQTESAKTAQALPDATRVLEDIFDPLMAMRIIVFLTAIGYMILIEF